MAYPCPVQFVQNGEGKTYKVLGVIEREIDRSYPYENFNDIMKSMLPRRELILEPCVHKTDFRW